MHRAEARWHAGVAELADARDLGSRGRKALQVRLLSPALHRRFRWGSRRCHWWLVHQWWMRTWLLLARCHRRFVTRTTETDVERPGSLVPCRAAVGQPNHSRHE